MAQPTTSRLRSHHTEGASAVILDETNNIYAEDHASRSQAGTSCAVDDPGGCIDDPGSGNTNDWGNFATGDHASRSQASTSCAVDDPGGYIDDPSSGNTNDWGSLSSFTTSASTSSKTSALYVSSSLTTRVSLLSISEKSTVDMVKKTNEKTKLLGPSVLRAQSRHIRGGWRWRRMFYVPTMPLRRQFLGVIKSLGLSALCV